MLKLVPLLPGSSARKLKRGGANLLAGRALKKLVFPLSNLEIELKLSQALQIGTFPGIYCHQDSALETLESY